MAKSYIYLFENGVNNYNLNLFHECSKTVNVAVKTPVGISKEKEINDIILQGETTSSIICTSTIDMIEKECNVERIKFRDEVEVPKLSFVDDIVDIHECGKKTKELNQFTTRKINERKLQLADDKTFRLHVGKEASCTEISLDKWKKDNEDKKSEFIDKYEGSSSIETKTEHEYLGLIVSDDGSNKKSIDQKVARAQGIINDIVAILETLHLGKFFFETALLLRNSLFLSYILHDIEIMHNLNQKDILRLESLDNQLVSRILGTSTKNNGKPHSKGTLQHI